MSCQINSRHQAVASQERFKKISLTEPKKAVTGKNSFIPIEFITLRKPATATPNLPLHITPTVSILSTSPSRKHTVSPANEPSNTTPQDLKVLEEDSAHDETNPELRIFQELLKSIMPK